MPQIDRKAPDAKTLRKVKLAHTVIWAFFASSIFAIPILAWMGRYRSFVFIAIVSIEVLVLVFNQWSCPLTAVAARYTDERAPNFDIYLPQWLARYNKLIFGFIYLAGSLYSLAKWGGWL